MGTRDVCIRCLQIGHNSAACKQPNPALFPVVKETKMLDRIEIDENTFCFKRRGEELQEWFCEREVLKDGRRGNWLLMRRTIAGLMIADRDQYSNDIIERLGIFLEGKPVAFAPYDRRFKRACSKAEYLENWSTWCAELEFQFDGVWTAEYQDWDGLAVMSKKLERPGINELLES